MNEMLLHACMHRYAYMCRRVCVCVCVCVCICPSVHVLIVLVIMAFHASHMYMPSSSSK